MVWTWCVHCLCGVSMVCTWYHPSGVPKVCIRSADGVWLLCDWCTKHKIKDKIDFFEEEGVYTFHLFKNIHSWDWLRGIVMKFGDLVRISFIKMYLIFISNFLIRTSLYCNSLNNERTELVTGLVTGCFGYKYVFLALDLSANLILVHKHFETHNLLCNTKETYLLWNVLKNQRCELVIGLVAGQESPVWEKE